MGNRVVHGSAVAQRLNDFCKETDDLGSETELHRWARKVASFLNTALGAEEANEFISLEANTHNEWDQHAVRVGHIQGLIARAAAAEVTADSAVESRLRLAPTVCRKVFVVHGHDNEAKEATARFLGKLGLTPIILHEQPNSGRTLIEKFEIYSDDVAFAIVLLTPDDVGESKASSVNLQPRARQNVVLELGYFLGRLGRSRVCALHKHGLELPSDYQGVAYVEMDAAGAWKSKLAQELIEAKISIDLAGLVGG